MQQEQITIRKIMQNEFTWLAMIIAAVMGFVSSVILPLQKIQIQLIQIQADISETQRDYQIAITEYNSLRSRIDVVETKINNLAKQR